MFLLQDVELNPQTIVFLMSTTHKHKVHVCYCSAAYIYCSAVLDMLVIPVLSCFAVYCKGYMYMYYDPWNQCPASSLSQGILLNMSTECLCLVTNELTETKINDKSPILSEH